MELEIMQKEDEEIKRKATALTNDLQILKMESNTDSMLTITLQIHTKGGDPIFTTFDFDLALDSPQNTAKRLMSELHLKSEYRNKIEAAIQETITLHTSKLEAVTTIQSFLRGISARSQYLQQLEEAKRAPLFEQYESMIMMRKRNINVYGAISQMQQDGVDETIIAVFERKHGIEPKQKLGERNSFGIERETTGCSEQRHQTEETALGRCGRTEGERLSVGATGRIAHQLRWKPL